MVEKVNEKWNEWSPAKRGIVVVLGIVQVSLLVAALIDLIRRPAEQIKGNKKLWFVVVFIDYIGPLAYFFLGRKEACECKETCTCGGEVCECEESCTCEETEECEEPCPCTHHDASTAEA